jgi:hypothetical protein
MRGTILGVHDGRGVLSDADARRLEFPISEWRSAGAPSPGQVVDFIEADGEARAIFAVPGAARTATPPAAQSGSFVLSAVALGCLAIGFFIPLLPTVAAFVLGIIGAQQAQREGDETALLLARIAWIGAIIMLVVGVLALTAVIALLGGLLGVATLFELGPTDF